MNFRALGLGLSVGLVALSAIPAIGQVHPNRLHLMNDAPAPPTPEQIIVSDGQAPLRAPAPLPPQIIHHAAPQMTPPTHVFVPHDGMAMRVHAIEEGTIVSHPLPPTIVAAHGPYDPRPVASHASQAAHSAPCVCAPQGHPSCNTASHPLCPVVYPSAYPATYAAPAYGYVAPQSSKVELLRCALNQLEMAGAEELAKQVKTEIAAEEKRELVEELSRKEADLKNLQSEIQTLREKIGGDAPQVLLKLQVLELDLAKARALGFDCKQALAGHGSCNLNCVQGQCCQGQSSCQGHAPCVVEANCGLMGLLNAMKSEGLVRVVNDHNVVASSGQPGHFVCAVVHEDDDTYACSERPFLGIKFDFSTTIQSEDCIRAEVNVRIGEAIESPAPTTGLEALPIVGGVASRAFLAIGRLAEEITEESMPPSIRMTGLNTGFEAKPGQTFMAALVRKGHGDKACCASKCKHNNPDCTEQCCKESCCKQSCCKELGCECKGTDEGRVLRLVLITPQIVNAEFKPAAKSSCEGCSAVKYEVSSASALRLKMMREPFLTNVDAPLDILGIVDVEFPGVEPQFLDEYGHQRQLNELEAQEFERMRVKILGGNADPNRADRWEGSDNTGIKGHSSQATPKATKGKPAASASEKLPSALFSFSIGLSR